MRVLVVEDERALADAIARGLRREGMAVDVAYDGDTGHEKATITRYDVVVLDRDLPGMSGDRLCAEIVSSGSTTRVLMLTASGTLADKVDGFSRGADDYLAKPFDPRELALRIRTILRRTAPPPAALLPQAPVQLGMRWFDAERSELRGPDGTIRLTGGEAALLAALARRPGEVLSREEIAAALGTPEAGERAVDVQVTRLRRKIEPDPREPRFLHTVRGRGYVLKPGQ
jgi:two-component system, OmpR family, phosphate regulon response regulator OmpR